MVDGHLGVVDGASRAGAPVGVVARCALDVSVAADEVARGTHGELRELAAAGTARELGLVDRERVVRRVQADPALPVRVQHRERDLTALAAPVGAGDAADDRAPVRGGQLEEAAEGQVGQVDPRPVVTTQDGAQRVVAVADSAALDHHEVVAVARRRTPGDRERHLFDRGARHRGRRGGAPVADRAGRHRRRGQAQADHRPGASSVVRGHPKGSSPRGADASQDPPGGSVAADSSMSSVLRAMGRA